MSTLAVVTGASRGIGAALVAAASADGATVATTSRSPLPGDHHLVIDIADPGQWPALGPWLDRTIAAAEPQRLVFVHNAATLDPIGYVGEVDPGAYAANVLVNSAAAQVIGDAAVRAANTADLEAVIVQLSSGVGKVPYAGFSSYGAAKAGIDMWCRVVGLEQEHRGGRIRVLSIAPGVVATDMQAEIRRSRVEDFPEVERFRAMHADGLLDDPGSVGARLWAYATTGDWANGAVADLRELA
ncbi:MAG: SDR family NAD(P)-dependent oxidoreductase [Actinomycetota bacterium]